jgi:hypothetical protein
MNTMNIFTNAFTDHSCLNKPPKNFKWIFNKRPENNEPVVYFDDFIFNYIDDGYTGPKYGWLGESSEVIHHLIAAIERNIESFKKVYKKIYTNDRRLIERHPDFYEYNPPASNMTWIKDCKIYDKSLTCSFITSFKSFTSGHIKRVMLYRDLENNPMFKGHIYGRDCNPLKDKLDGLKDYRFSIAMENTVYPKYYTEKILDCFATGTIPIYYGDRSIGEDFDSNGIIFLDDLKSFEDLTEERYINMMPAIKHNFEKVMNLKTSDDCLYESVTNDSIKYS